MKQILVALDTSARAAGVFDVAAELAGRFEATLHPFRAIRVPPEFPRPDRESDADPLLAHIADAAVADMRKLAARAPNVDAAGPTTKAGQPWRMILEAAEELDVDLIVVGSQGLGRVLGTTAGKVANMAKRNVLVVHSSDHEVLLVRHRASSS